jgi:hypothetical protein
VKAWEGKQWRSRAGQTQAETYLHSLLQLKGSDGALVEKPAIRLLGGFQVRLGSLDISLRKADETPSTYTHALIKRSSPSQSLFPTNGNIARDGAPLAMASKQTPRGSRGVHIMEVAKVARTSHTWIWWSLVCRFFSLFLAPFTFFSISTRAFCAGAMGWGVSIQTRIQGTWPRGPV